MTPRISFLPLLVLISFLAAPASAVNITAADVTTILPPDAAYIPFEIWLPIAIAPFLFLFLSLYPNVGAHDLWAILAFVFSAAAAYLSTAIAFAATHTEVIDGTVCVVPVETVVHPAGVPYLLLAVTLASIINVWRVVWEEYLRPIRDAKLRERGEMPPMR